MHKLYGFDKYDWENNNKKDAIYPATDRWDFCNCCGAEQFSEDSSSFKEDYLEDCLGIAVIFDKVMEENQRGYKKIKHVETKNGPVTVYTITGLTANEREELEHNDDW